MKKKQKIFIAIALAAVLVFGCTLYFGVNPALNRMTDKELIQTMLDNDDVWNRSLSSYVSPFGQVATLRQSSPEFNELMTRFSGIKSLKSFEPTSEQDALELEWLLAHFE